MEKFSKILKNILIFLVVFLALQYIFQSCQGKDTTEESTDDLTFVTTDDEYSKVQTVTVKLVNNTKNSIIIPSDCPGEPFDVYRYENGNFVKKEATPVLDCTSSKNYTLEPGKKYLVPYENWNHTLFSELGRYKIEFKTKIGDEEKTFATNEFDVVEESLFKKLWTGIFYRPIYNGLIFLAKIAPAHDLGFAIILLTIIIRTILLIPSQKSMRSQQKMQEIQPRLEKIKEMYKGNDQKIASETMAVWKEAKVNPFGSCLPILLQFPFLIALFYAIKGGLNPDNTYLFYTSYQNFSLADINVQFLGILDLTKANLYVLPLIIGGLQFVQMKLSLSKKKKKSDDKKEKKNEMAIANNMMTYMMPVMIAVFTASLPAGVGLYWGISTIYGIIQQLVVNRSKLGNNDEPKVRVITTS